MINTSPITKNVSDSNKKKQKSNKSNDTILANSKGQSLTLHSLAVGILSKWIIKDLVGDEKLAAACYVAGCLHDLGKIDPSFQEWIQKKLKSQSDELPDDGQHIESGKFSFEKHPRHNEISLLLYHLLEDHASKKLNSASIATAKHVMYWHHAKPFRKAGYESLDDIYTRLSKSRSDSAVEKLYKDAVAFIASVDEQCVANAPRLSELINDELESDRLKNLNDVRLPRFKQYSSANDHLKDYAEDVKENARNNIARAAVITADRLISNLSVEELIRLSNENKVESLFDHQGENKLLVGAIRRCLSGFDERFPASSRNTDQHAASDRLSKNKGVAVLCGPAGCGKTKIALEWAVKSDAKKILWICPRVQVCQGLFADLQQNEYLPGIKLEIVTGEFRQTHQNGETQETPEEDRFSGDVVVTTIDQVANNIITHTQVTSLVDYLGAHVVFDEFHEYINIPAFDLLFAELLDCKKLGGEHENSVKTLLVSATPNYVFLEKFLGLDKRNVVSVPSFNKSLYSIQFDTFKEDGDDSNLLYQTQPANTFVISNTANDAQRSFIKNQNLENAVLLHSKYKRTDKEKLFSTVYESFKQGGSHAHDILRSGPIVQAALNISCSYMVSELSHAENWLQRLGRLNRFAESDQATYTTALTDSMEGAKPPDRAVRFLRRLNAFKSTKAWLDFLKNKIDPECQYTIAAIYSLYEKFYDTKEGKACVEADIRASLQASTGLVNKKILEPVTINRSKKTGGLIRIKNNSLRGDNRFVQMATRHAVSLTDSEVLNEYAYPEEELSENLTLPVEEIEGYGDTTKSLLAEMMKKHHNIRGGKKAFKDSILLNAARSPDRPIYTSYTPEDLKTIEAMPHDEAIYYVVGLRQAIGCMSIKKLTEGN